MPRSRPPQAPDRTRPVLSCRGVSKAFGEVRANQDIDLDLYPGRVHALVGENGAGKSTLLSILSGRLRPDSGRIEIRGRAVRQLSPARAMAAGLGMVHQRFMLVDSLSVAENLALGAKGVRSPDIRRLAKRYGLDVDPDRMVLDLSMGERQRVEILKILCRDAETLFLDEPTSVLTEPEIRSLFRVLDRLRADGRAILFVTHKLAEISGLADEVSVLRRGRMAARNLPADRDPRDLARLMFGRDTAKAPERQPPSPGRVVIEVESLSGRDSHGREAFRDVSFDLRKGEILALLGVAGNGQAELVQCLTGLARPASGRIRFAGRAGDLAYVPEDRYLTGSVADMTLAENMLLTSGPGSGRLLDLGRARRMAQQAIDEYGISDAHPETRARELSGGNLQKLVLARELARETPLVVLEQPTQGLDLRSSLQVRSAIAGHREASAVLLVTGDTAEALGLADRVAVMFRGRISGTLEAVRGDPGQAETLGRLMAGLGPEAQA